MPIFRQGAQLAQTVEDKVRPKVVQCSSILGDERACATGADDYRLWRIAASELGHEPVA